MCLKLHFETGFIAQHIDGTGRPQAEFGCAGSEAEIFDPIVVIASQEAIKAVPSSYRDAAYAMGANRWQVVKAVVLPQALPGMMSGIILALSRAIGESAPILIISSLVW